MKPRQLTSERHRAIMRALDGAEAVNIIAFVRLTGVSAVAICRDLMGLAHKDPVARAHGGALRPPKRGTAHPFPLRKTQDLETKHLLTKATACLINGGESVVLDNGTICDLVAEDLVGRDIAVLALSLRAAVALAEAPRVHVVVPGGVVETASLTMLASPVTNVVKDFRADVAAPGTCATSVTNGLTCTSPPGTTLRRNISQSITRATFPATPRELARFSVHRFGTFEDLTDLLTTSDILEKSLVDLRSSEVPITTYDQHDPKTSGSEPQTTGPRPRTTELGASKTG